MNDKPIEDKSADNQPLLSDVLNFDSDQIKAFYFDSANTPSFFQSDCLGLYDRIRIMDYHLAIMADLKGKQIGESSFANFKKICLAIQSFTLKPSLVKLLTKKKTLNEEAKLQQSEESNNCSQQAQLVSKWWKTYFSLLEEAFEAHIADECWMGNGYEWFNQSDEELLEESLNYLGEYYHLKVMLMRTICSKEKFFKQLVSQGMMKPGLEKKFDVFYKECLKYFVTLAEKNLEMIEKAQLNYMSDLMKIT